MQLSLSELGDDGGAHWCLLPGTKRPAASSRCRDRIAAGQEPQGAIRLKPAGGSRQPVMESLDGVHAQLPETSGCVGQPLPLLMKWPVWLGDRAAGRESVKPLPGRCGPCQQALSKPAFATGQPVEYLLPVGRDANGRIGRCQAPAVSHEIDQRDINLMADASNHRDWRRGYGPHERLLVKRPKILKAAPTANQRHDVAGWPKLTSKPQAGSQFLSCACALDSGWNEHHLRQRPTAEQRFQKVGNGCP